MTESPLSSRKHAALLLYVAVAGLAGWAGTRFTSQSSEDETSEAPPAAPSRVEPSHERPDVILLTIDTLRADVLGCYGSKLGFTPTIDRLAARGTRFDYALAPSSWTVPSMASLMTGLWPEEHGVNRGVIREQEILGQERLPQGLPTLAEAFRDQGYMTAGVAANSHLSAPLGFDQGFELFHNVGFSSSRSVIKWIQRHRAALLNRERPRFIWVHLFDPHHPYTPHRRWFERGLRAVGVPESRSTAKMTKLATQLGHSKMRELQDHDDLDKGSLGLKAIRAAYLSEVARVDRAIERVLELVEATDDTVIVLTVDHGEEFRDHGFLGHRTTLYAELVHVPLIIVDPMRRRWSQTVSGRVSLVDLYPTLLDIAGIAQHVANDPEEDHELQEKALSGVSLVYDDGFYAPRGRPVHSTVWHKGRFLRSTAVGDLRLIWDEGDDRFELYDELIDPANKVDLAETRQDDLACLQGDLENYLRNVKLRVEPERPAELEAETVEQLRNLGYIE